MNNLYLRIGVYRGGDYWKECWESIKQNLDLFDGVFISFNYSELQTADIALIRDFYSDKIHWIKQDRTLTAVEHAIIFDHWLRDFHLKGHIFILCHDDILLRDGLLELKKLKLQPTDAVMGGYHFFYQLDSEHHRPIKSSGENFNCSGLVFDSKHYRPITVHECCSQTGIPMKKDLFFYLFEYRTLNVSGIVIPTSCWKHHKYLPIHLLIYGHWAEYCCLSMPEIEKIYQTSSPLTKIRLHRDSEGTKTTRRAFLYDSLFHYCHIFAIMKNEKIKDKMIVDIIYILKDYPCRGLWYFIRNQWNMRKLDYYYPAAWMIYYYILKKLLLWPIRHLYKR